MLVELPVLTTKAHFVAGNLKLGPAVLGWSIPAARTCPGATAACLGSCYALQGHYAWPSVQESHRRNLEASQSPEFAAWAIAQIRASPLTKVRVHVSGDLYSPEYTLKWHKIIGACRNKTFWMYTRSWRMPAFLPALRRLAKHENLHLWLSTDAHATKPPYIKHARVAFMARTDDEARRRPKRTDLIFRDNDQTVMKSVGGVQVCPAEIGKIHRTSGELYHMTCSQCKICFTEPR